MSENFESTLASLTTALANLDPATVDQSLDTLFHGILSDDPDPDTFGTTCHRLISILDGFRQGRSLDTIMSLIRSEESTKEKQRYIFDIIYNWFSHEFSESINFVRNCDKMQYSRKVRGALEYIDRNFRKEFSVETLAEQLEISPAYLSFLFKKETKRSVMTHVINLRLNEAKKLLRNTNMKIYEVADEVGFNSSQYFSKVFNRRMHLTPIQYREIKRKQLGEES